MHPEPGQLALLANPRIGQPDRRHQVALAQHRQHHRVDLVGLAGQRREALDLLGVGDLDVPALLLERVVDEPSTSHRLDDGADRLCVNLVDSSRERSQRVEVRRATASWSSNIEVGPPLSALLGDSRSVSPEEALLHGSPRRQ